MTDSGWTSCTDPYELLAHLTGKPSGWRDRLAACLGRGPLRMRTRKLQLFAAACCRRVWQLLPEDRSRWAVEVLERGADGLARKKELRQASEVAAEVAFEAESPRLANSPWLGAAQARAADAVAGAFDPREGAKKAAIWAREAARAFARGAPPDMVSGSLPQVPVPQAVWFGDSSWSGEHDPVPVPAPALDLESLAGETAWRREGRAQADLLRDIFGNPFHPVAFNPAWRSPEVVALARKMYDERHFEALPELADLLKKLGGLDPAILDHCATDVHVRGCWVIDLLLSGS